MCQPYLIIGLGICIINITEIPQQGNSIPSGQTNRKTYTTKYFAAPPQATSVLEIFLDSTIYTEDEKKLLDPFNRGPLNAGTKNLEYRILTFGPNPNLQLSNYYKEDLVAWVELQQDLPFLNNPWTSGIALVRYVSDSWQVIEFLVPERGINTDVIYTPIPPRP